MKILDIEVPEHYSYGVRTASLTMLNEDGEKKIVHVETKDGLYRRDLGCLIYSDEGEIDNENEFFDYEIDKVIIIKAVESFINGSK